jgi:hypothetical protein
MSIRNVSLLGLLFAVFAINISAHAAGDVNKKASALAGKKEPFTISRGDAQLTVGGKSKTEYIVGRNQYMLNELNPDEQEYFKQTVDLTLDFAYGKEKYGHEAVKFFTDIRCKGVWGKALSFAEKDSGSEGPSFVTLSKSRFGTHSHASGKALLWVKDAWTLFSVNAALGLNSENVHTVKAGWFPFELGRGIALGGFYGIFKEAFGSYSYKEDKAAPGIQVHGDLIKDRLTYDLYYAKFEERGYDFWSNIAPTHRHIVNYNRPSWTGENKDDDLVAARLQFKALKDSALGSLDFEPYIFYNNADDQKVEILPDSRLSWGSYGFTMEHSYKNFEWGGEVAFNYGNQYVYNVDRNKAQITNRNGTLVEQFSHLVDNNNFNVLVTDASIQASTQKVTDQSNRAINIANGASTDYPDIFSKEDRFRPAYINHLRGYMGVIDATYNFKDQDLKVSAAYGYASGDIAPHDEAKDKTYSGFIGLHELYSGKRVSSLILLDERNTFRPLSLASREKDQKSEDSSFSDLQHVGLGVTWEPRQFAKNKLSINPNVLAFWKAYRSFKYDADAKRVTDVPASAFMGTEINLLAKVNLVQDLKMFINLATFVPGQYYKDVSGVSLGVKNFIDMQEDPRDPIDNAAKYLMGSSTALFLNVGLEYKF